MYRRGSQGGGGGGFGPALTPMVKRLLIANGVIFVFQLFLGPGFTYTFAVSVDGVLAGYLWQPFTYMWLHSPNSFLHILFNMFALWMFGGQLESVWGSRKFLRFYLTCGVGAGFTILIWNSMMVEYGVPTLGASGAIYGILMAFGLLWPDRRLTLIFPPIPVKAIYFIPFLFLIQMIGGGSNISHAGHLGGVLVALVLMRKQAGNVFSVFSTKRLRYRWHRFRMRGRLKAVRREDWDRRRRDQDDDDRPTFH